MRRATLPDLPGSDGAIRRPQPNHEIRRKALFGIGGVPVHELFGTHHCPTFELATEHQPERRPDPEVLLRLRHLFLDREIHWHGSAQVSALRSIRRWLGLGHDHGNLPRLLFGTPVSAVARNFSRSTSATRNVRTRWRSTRTQRRASKREALHSRFETHSRRAPSCSAYC